MAQLDSRIPMMGIQPNVMNALAGGARAAKQAACSRRKRTDGKPRRMARTTGKDQKPMTALGTRVRRLSRGDLI